MTFATINPTESDPNAPLISSLFKRMIGNPEARLDQTSGPIIPGVWHPYDMVDWDDGADGVIYDNAVDGNLSTVVSPDFVDGYEYRFLGIDLIQNINGTEVLELYGETADAYDADNVDLLMTTTRNQLEVTVHFPRLVERVHRVTGYVNTNNANESRIEGSSYYSTAQKILKARFNTGGS
jgi:hypothetical protein